MAIILDTPSPSTKQVMTLSMIYVPTTLVLFLLLKVLYNLFLHPLAKYPGPLLWRASRLPASYHHASGDLYKCIATIHSEYGSTVRIAPNELSFAAPEAWPHIYNSKPQLQKSPYHFGSNPSKDRPESMITAPDAEHARLRRLAAPAFTTRGVEEVEPVLQHCADTLVTQLTQVSGDGHQNLVEWFLWTLNDVIGKLALDMDFQCLEKRRMHPWPSFLLTSLKSVAKLNQLRRFGFNFCLLKPFLPKSIVDAQENFFNTAATAVSQRLKREDEDQSVSKPSRPDIVGLMLREMKGGDRLSQAEITSNSILIVGGGAETTSTCLSSLFYHLCKTPRVMKKLQCEIRQAFATNEAITIKATRELPFLCATIDEALRIFPVASYITPRVTPKEGHSINGQHVPGKTHVSMAQWHMGRSERFFDNPMEFRPERWLHGDSQDSVDESVKDVLSPFSLGPRNCLGKMMALIEARLVTAKLLWNFDIDLDGDHTAWVDDARFYILWELQPLNVRLTPAVR